MAPRDSWSATGGPPLPALHGHRAPLATLLLPKAARPQPTAPSPPPTAGRSEADEAVLCPYGEATHAPLCHRKASLLDKHTQDPGRQRISTRSLRTHEKQATSDGSLPSRLLRGATSRVSRRALQCAGSPVRDTLAAAEGTPHDFRGGVLSETDAFH